jgi:hypothetical protein
MAITKEVKRGRPQLYPLTARQEARVIARLEKGQSASFIAAALGVHEFAVLRVRRSLV